MIRLLHCGNWALEEHNESHVPDYAILSHTWELPYPDGSLKEVTYQDVKARLASDNPTNRPAETAQLKASGWTKVEKARNEAWGLGFAWIWIDSCCINTEDLQEHGEAINSMYEWYQNSQLCIAHLSDLQGYTLGRCRWFYRGWTLQELIAPPAVFFYNQHWNYCGSRNGRPKDNHLLIDPGEEYEYSEDEDLSEKIAKITSIDRNLLRKNDSRRIKQALSSIPACQKMHWAWERKTSRSEDMAYCLIGIFDVNHFYLKRGERDAAFIRLQEEIIKESSDPTLFAWRAINREHCLPTNRLHADRLRGKSPLFAFTEDLHGIFACRPSEFRFAGNIHSTEHVMYNDEIRVTSKGLKLTAALWGEGPAAPFTMSIKSFDRISQRHLGIQLRWVGGNVYARTNVESLEDLDVDQALPSQDDIFILRKVHSVQDCAASLHENAFHLPMKIEDSLFTLSRIGVSPGALWHRQSELFMTSGSKLPVGCAFYELSDNASFMQTFRKHHSTPTFTFLFGLDYTNEPWSCLIEPNSQLAPRDAEMRRAYVDRVWRNAFQIRGVETKMTFLRGRSRVVSIVRKTLIGSEKVSAFVLGVQTRRESWDDYVTYIQEGGKKINGEVSSGQWGHNQGSVGVPNLHREHGHENWRRTVRGQQYKILDRTEVSDQDQRGSDRVEEGPTMRGDGMSVPKSNTGSRLAGISFVYGDYSLIHRHRGMSGSSFGEPLEQEDMKNNVILQSKVGEQGVEETYRFVWKICDEIAEELLAMEKKKLEDGKRMVEK